AVAAGREHPREEHAPCGGSGHPAGSAHHQLPGDDGCEHHGHGPDPDPLPRPPAPGGRRTRPLRHERLTMTDTSSPTALPRVGIIGTGGISRAHAPGWAELGVELHCYSLEGAEDFAALTGARVHGTLAELLDAVDVVDVCAPTPAHPELVRAALEAGRDVICEKPPALTPEEAQELVAHAERVGRKLFPAHVVRYFPQYAAAKRAIDTGAVGTLAVLRFERTGSLPDRDWYAD